MTATPPTSQPDPDLGQQMAEATRAMEVSNPDAGSGPVDRVVNLTAEIIGVSVLVTIVLSVFANAVGRYIAGASLIWAEEMVISLIPWLAMSGMFLAIRRRQVIRIEAFTERMPPMVRRALGVFTSLLAAATFTVLAYHAFSYVSLFGGDTTIYLKLPTGWFTSAMMIGAIAASLAYLVDAWRQR